MGQRVSTVPISRVSIRRLYMLTNGSFLLFRSPALPDSKNRRKNGMCGSPWLILPAELRQASCSCLLSFPKYSHATSQARRQWPIRQVCTRWPKEGSSYEFLNSILQRQLTKFIPHLRCLCGQNSPGSFMKVCVFLRWLCDQFTHYIPLRWYVSLVFGNNFSFFLLRVTPITDRIW